jgi:HAMP domain-containing protein
MQSAVTSVGLRLVSWSYLALGMCWAAGTAAAGIMAFALRTRSRRTNNTIDLADLADKAAAGDAVQASTTRASRPQPGEQAMRP